ncbi:MAG TPA: DUF429 domain-containing protein [Terriglobales bacterium]|nr:DUF429 domain-containing protein [Terriglobales bacterium]
MIDAGVDACKAGWIIIQRVRGTDGLFHCLAGSFTEAVEMMLRAAVVAVDMPIGLLDKAAPGGRICDRMARAILGHPRGSSVFSPPVRSALSARSYRQANAANRASSSHNIGLSLQTYRILSKLAEVDAALTPQRQDRILEVHPELSFFELNGGRPINEKKKSGQGLRARRALLEAAGFVSIDAVIHSYKRNQVAADDIFDACAACWSAGRIASGEAIRIPERPALDSRGLRMEIWR